MSSIFVSVIVPVRNEEKHLASCLRSLLQQTYLAGSYEVIVVDGRSSDRTREVVKQFEGTFHNIRCLDNPAAIVSSAMNIGIKAAAGEIIIRADGHNVYPSDYIEKSIEYLTRTGADNVGGPITTVPSAKSIVARLVAAILSNSFGVGDSRFRTTTAEGFVDTVPFGAFRREIFTRVGLFNEKLVRNQDNEFNARIRKAGGKVFQTPALTTEYYPSASFNQLVSQTFKNSQWHVFSMEENVNSMSIRHFVPAAFVLSLLILLCAINWAPAKLLLVVVLALYFLLATYFSFRKSWQYGWTVCSVLPFACLCFHVVYGVGTLMGLRYLFKSPSFQPIRPGQPIHLDHDYQSD